MSRADLRGTAVALVSFAFVFGVAPGQYGSGSLAEDLFGGRLGGLAELAIASLGVALFVGFLAYRRIPTDPDDRGWVPEE